MPDAALLGVVRLDALPRLVRRMEEGFGGEIGDAAEPWRALRQRLEDALEDLSMQGLGEHGGPQGWGLRLEEPLAVTLGPVGGEPLARALLTLIQILSGDAPPALAALSQQAAVDAALADVPPAIWHARLTLGLRDPTQLQQALSGVAARVGLSEYPVGAPPPPWAASLTLSPDVLWVGQDPETGMLILARGRGDHGALDVVAAATPKVEAARLIPVATREGARWPRAEGALAVSLKPSALLPLEAGLDAHLGLSSATRTEGQGRMEVLQAVAGLTAACTGLWRRLGEVAQWVELSVSAEPHAVVVRGAVKLTHRGGRAWRGVVAPPVLSSKAAEVAPAGFQITAGRRPFAALIQLPDIPGDPVAFVDEIGGCGVGHPGISALMMLAVLPALVGAEALPVPEPASGPLAGPQPESQAAVILGFEIRDGEPVPRVGALAVGLDGEIPPDGEPLGPDARLEMTPQGPQWTLDGPGIPVGYLRRPRGRGRTAVLFTFGADALAELDSHIIQPTAPGPRRQFLQAWLSPGRLAMALKALGVGPLDTRALEAIDAQLGDLTLTGHLEGRRLDYALRLGRAPTEERAPDPPPAKEGTAALDRGPGAY